MTLQRRVIWITWVASLFSVTYTYADYTPPIYIYSQGGSEGVGIGFGMKLNPSWAIRAEVNGFNYTTKASDSGLSSTMKRKLRTAGIYADYFPTEYSVRITGGLMLNQSQADYSATSPSPDGATLTLNGSAYHLGPGDTVAASAKTSPIMPYLGIGYGHDEIETTGFTFHADLGIAFGNKPKTSLTLNAPDLATDATVEANRQAEEQKMQHDLKFFRFFPVAKMGVGYIW